MKNNQGGGIFYLRKWVFKLKPVLYQSIPLLGTNISHLCQRKILFPVLRRVLGRKKLEQNDLYIFVHILTWHLEASSFMTGSMNPFQYQSLYWQKLFDSLCCVFCHLDNGRYSTKTPASTSWYFVCSNPEPWIEWFCVISFWHKKMVPKLAHLSLGSKEWYLFFCCDLRLMINWWFGLVARDWKGQGTLK